MGYAWSGSPQPHSQEDPSSSRHCAWRSVIPELGTLSSAWSWIPPCHVWSTVARRWNCFVVGVCASKVCTQTAFCTFRQALLCSASPRSCTHLLWIVVFPSSSESGDQSEYGYDRPRSCSRCVLLWSGCVRFGLWGALLPKLSESRLNSRECVRHSFPQLFPLRLGCVPRGQWAPGTSSTASGRCSRSFPSRGFEEGLVLPRAAHPELLLSLLTQRVVASQSCAPCQS